MPFYLKKSVSAGPFRFNFSKSGVGISAGVTGFRIGTGPKGHYIHAGRGGLYYRTALGGARGNKSKASPGARRSAPIPRIDGADPDIEMIPVSSEEVTGMHEAKFAELLGDLNEIQASTPMATVLGWIGGGIAMLALLSAGFGGLIVGVIFGVAAYLFGAWLDSYQRCAVLMYELETEAADAYERLTAAFDELASCAGVWHIDAGGAVTDIHSWKRNAGASHVLDRFATSLSYALPPIIKANVTPPAFNCGKETLYFFPDMLLVVHGKKVGAVAYENFVLRTQDSNFIEEDSLPHDAVVLWYSWKHPNKNGGPDRRFADNHQIPVCAYESLYFSSSNGLNELLQVSRRGLGSPFADCVKALASANGSARTTKSIPNLS